MKQRVYIETSIVSYLTARPSRELIAAVRQAVTDMWWRKWRPMCEVFVSEFVIGEAARGDDEAARRRLAALAEIPRLPASDEARTLAKMLTRAHAIPSAAEDDAAHVAVAAVCSMDVLLTWNCTHIANVIAAPRIRDIIERAGYRAPTITTPQGLLESMGELP
jgi:hypothetical protein